MRTLLDQRDARPWRGAGEGAARWGPGAGPGVLREPRRMAWLLRQRCHSRFAAVRLRSSSCYSSESSERVRTYVCACSWLSSEALARRERAFALAGGRAGGLVVWRGPAQCCVGAAQRGHWVVQGFQDGLPGASCLLSRAHTEACGRAVGEGVRRSVRATSRGRERLMPHIACAAGRPLCNGRSLQCVPGGRGGGRRPRRRPDGSCGSARHSPPALAATPPAPVAVAKKSLAHAAGAAARQPPTPKRQTNCLPLKT